MGRDFEYCICDCRPDARRYPEYDDWREIMDGRIVDGRNMWEGPGSDYEDTGFFTRAYMIDMLKDYVENNNNYGREFRFTLKAFGRIISEMYYDDSVVYIRFD